MITRSQQKNAREKAIQLFRNAGIILSVQEEQAIEVADFGLSNLEVEGAQILTLVQTERLSVKLLALMPYQTEPEHWHPPIGDYPGKEETVRHLYGELYFYIDGPDCLSRGYIPAGKEMYYTMRNEIVLRPGEQLTCQPGTKHWFQAGVRGAALFSFSTVARDTTDLFTDPDVQRKTEVR